jgi:hypothetical protein
LAKTKSDSRKIGLIVTPAMYEKLEQEKNKRMGLSIPDIIRQIVYEKFVDLAKNDPDKESLYARPGIKRKHIQLLSTHTPPHPTSRGKLAQKH